MKSTNISSATGRRPEQAAPTAAPMNADSLIGVSRIRSGYLEYSPLVTPSTPPQASISPAAPCPPTLSSPNTTTVGSRLISWSRASLIAFMYVIVRATGEAPFSVLNVDVGEQVRGVGLERGLGVGDRVVDQPGHLLVHAAQLLGVDQARRSHLAGEQVQAVTGTAQLLDLARGPVGLLIALEVAVVAVDPALQQGGAAAAAGPGDRLAGRLVDREEVVAVDHHAGQAEAVGALDNVGPGAGVVLDAGGLGVAVVFHHVDARQVPDRGQVEALQEGALVGAAVTGERHPDLVGAADLGGQADAADHRRAAADDPVGAEHALVHVGDVHRAALAVAEPVTLAVDLGHHAVHVAALGDGVAVAAVGGGDVVVGPEVRADAGGDGLLARVQVDEAGDLPGGELLVETLLELPDRPHGAVPLQELLLAGLVWRGGGGHVGLLVACVVEASWGAPAPCLPAAGRRALRGSGRGAGPSRSGHAGVRPAPAPRRRRSPAVPRRAAR